VMSLLASTWTLSRPGSLAGLETESITTGLELAVAATGTRAAMTAAAAASRAAAVAAVAARRSRRRITVKLHNGGRSEQYRNITFRASGATATSFVNGQVTHSLTGRLTWSGGAGKPGGVRRTDITASG
jgi:hypothetical protein